MAIEIYRKDATIKFKQSICFKVLNNGTTGKMCTWSIAMTKKAAYGCLQNIAALYLFAEQIVSCIKDW